MKLKVQPLLIHIKIIPNIHPNQSLLPKKAHFLPHFFKVARMGVNPSF